MSKKALEALYESYYEIIDEKEEDKLIRLLKLFTIIERALEKLETIEVLVDKKRFNTDDIELLRDSIIEVLERDEKERDDE